MCLKIADTNTVYQTYIGVEKVACIKNKKRFCDVSKIPTVPHGVARIHYRMKKTFKK